VTDPPGRTISSDDALAPARRGDREPVPVSSSATGALLMLASGAFHYASAVRTAASAAASSSVRVITVEVATRCSPYYLNFPADTRIPSDQSPEPRPGSRDSEPPRDTNGRAGESTDAAALCHRGFAPGNLTKSSSRW
jgi:hypothetical protein